jgi:hypothetical protein
LSSFFKIIAPLSAKRRTRRTCCFNVLSFYFLFCFSGAPQRKGWQCRRSCVLIFLLLQHHSMQRGQRQQRHVILAQCHCFLFCCNTTPWWRGQWHEISHIIIFFLLLQCNS